MKKFESVCGLIVSLLIAAGVASAWFNVTSYSFAAAAAPDVHVVADR